MQQEEIEVWLGNKFMTVVPKASEPFVRQQYYGKPEEKKLVIKPRINVSKEELNKIVTKLKP
jgi:hypothetical protein